MELLKEDKDQSSPMQKGWYYQGPQGPTIIIQGSYLKQHIDHYLSNNLSTPRDKGPLGTQETYIEM